MISHLKKTTKIIYWSNKEVEENAYIYKWLILLIYKLYSHNKWLILLISKLLYKLTNFNDMENIFQYINL